MATSNPDLGRKTMLRLRRPDGLSPAAVAALRKHCSWLEGALKGLNCPRAHGLAKEQWQELAQRVHDHVAHLGEDLLTPSGLRASKRASAVLRGAKYPSR